jgi:hypothetical protein
MIRTRFLVAAVAAVAAAVVVAAPAGADVTVMPAHVDAGRAAPIAFTANFGCQYRRL